MSELVDILNYDRDELASELSERFGYTTYRANQLFHWLYKRGHKEFEEMSNISRSARDELRENYRVSRPKIRTVQQSVDGTRKYLFDLPDGKSIESVLIKQPKRYTLCVSSQVGCAIGCKFCRTALMGLVRNLQTAEIVGQVLAVKDDIRKINAEQESEIDFYNIVFMGMGEPLHNYENLTRAVRILNDELGLHFSQRKLTVSTSGLVPAIEKFGRSKAKANLAVSLNATTDEVREAIIPINRKWPLESLLRTLREYPLGKGKRITIEYVMLRDVNDTAADLKRLPKLLHEIPSKINLIPYNQNAGLNFRAPLRDNVDYWQKTLLDKGLNATVRWSKGEDIDAACGQLATQKSVKKEKTTNLSN